MHMKIKVLLEKQIMHGFPFLWSLWIIFPQGNILIHEFLVNFTLYKEKEGKEMVPIILG